MANAPVYRDQILDTMVCSACSRYLSVLPVHVYPNRTVKCGRCIQEDDLGAPSQVNKVYTNMLFKCVNRYEGCTSLLLPDQVVKHEKTCVSRCFNNCPLCSDENMPPYKMLEHFRRQHGRYLLKKPTFKVDATFNSDKYFLYCTDNRVFMLNVSVDTMQSKIYLDNKLLGPEMLTKNISQQFRILDDTCYVASESQPCDTFLKKRFDFCVKGLEETNNLFCELILDFNIVNFKTIQLTKPIQTFINYMAYNRYNRKIFLSSRNQELYALSTSERFVIDEELNIKLPVFCSFCGDNLYAKSFFYYQDCSEPTVCCYYCRSAAPQTCSKGHELNGYIWDNEDYLEIEVYCKWNCGEHFKCIELYKHEQDCVCRDAIEICPVENCTARNFKSFLEFRIHFESHKNALLSPFWECTTWFDRLISSEYYVVYDHVTVVFSSIYERVKLKSIIQNDQSQYKIFINKTQIAVNEEIKITHPSLRIRVIDDCPILCKN